MTLTLTLEGFDIRGHANLFNSMNASGTFGSVLRQIKADCGGQGDITFEVLPMDLEKALDLFDAELDVLRDLGADQAVQDLLEQASTITEAVALAPLVRQIAFDKDKAIQANRKNPPTRSTAPAAGV